MTSLQILYIVLGVVCVVVVAVVVVLIVHCRERRASRRGQSLVTTNHVVIKPNHNHNDNHTNNIYKRNSKMSNLEVRFAHEPPHF